MRSHLVLLRGAMGSGKSAVAKSLCELSRATVKVIEIDRIKRAKYGTPEKCDPAVDFTEAGREAKLAMDKGFHVVVVEPLCDQSHVQLVLQATGRFESSQDVLSVWLECTIETAIARKKAAHRIAVIEDQHRRYSQRYRPRGELLIRTDQLSVAEVADEILREFPAGK